MTPQPFRTVRREIDAIVQRGRTLVVGPWLGEVGFEALYWIPFMQWVAETWKLPADRLVAVSRGGVGSWYAGIASRYLELWDDLSLPAFVQGNASRGMRKQYTVAAFDAALLARTWARLGIEGDVLHPSLMYRLKSWVQAPWRCQDYPFRFRPMGPVAPVFDPAVLPASYVAMKLYTGDCLPDTPVVRETLRALVTETAQRSPVVLLDTGLALQDGHEDYDYTQIPGVVSARPWLPWQRNLGAQTQIIAGASAFVGPCGGLTWLAPRCGVDVTALCVADALRAKLHIEHARAAYTGGRFRVQDVVTGQPWPVTPIPTRTGRFAPYTWRNVRGATA